MTAEQCDRMEKLCKGVGNAFDAMMKQWQADHPSDKDSAEAKAIRGLASQSAKPLKTLSNVLAQIYTNRPIMFIMQDKPPGEPGKEPFNPRMN